MEIHNESIHQQAMTVLRSLYGEGAKFRSGQYEAIEATMLHRRTLVVQRTGWGKSLVYFTCTKLLRNQGRGLTIVVSPLLTLMENQIEAAGHLGLRCDALNSTTADRRPEILDRMAAGTLDLVLVTPETLFREDIQACLPKISIGLFVIDEAHCFSAWGHDFRLDYSRLRDVILRLPQNVPILATTATANNRVVNDLAAQLGGNVHISRGPLTRESLSIQVLDLPGKAERYAWLLANLERLPGSGIIYCLTQRDCDVLARFLQNNGISALSYYSRSPAEEHKNQEAEEAFRNNQIKALVATIKLGMGYDKGDIAFVIHFQTPQNIVSYYQQIGRAGRSIPHAYVFLMNGREDEEIINYFMKTAFPTEEEMTQVYRCIQSQDSIGLNELLSKLNIRRSRLEKCLMFLTKDKYITKDRSRYRITPTPFVYQKEHYDAITAIRRQELEQMKELVRTGECYSQFIVRALDDPDAHPCGRCANCLGRDILDGASQTAPLVISRAASEFLRGQTIPITPRKQWASSSVTRMTKIPYINQEGVCLCKYGDPGLGELVRQGKYSAEKRFCDELVERGAEVVQALAKEKGITHITCVPSLRSDLVPDYARRLAKACGLPFVELLQKSSADQQKTMENSSHQCANAFQSFSVMNGVQTLPRKVLLVDDMVDSKWTLTVCGCRLMEKGCQEVYPFALADSSQKEED